MIIQPNFQLYRFLLSNRIFIYVKYCSVLLNVKYKSISSRIWRYKIINKKQQGILLSTYEQY